MPSAAMKCFLISIDTEGDSLWTPGKAGTTRNAAFLARFQADRKSTRLNSSHT